MIKVAIALSVVAVVVVLVGSTISAAFGSFNVKFDQVQNQHSLIEAQN